MNWTSFYLARKQWRTRFDRTMVWRFLYTVNGNPTPKPFGTCSYANSHGQAFVYYHDRKTWALDVAYARYLDWSVNKCQERLKATNT